ncbi:MAG: L-serine ammonia-lyase, iron-sulfur-dependent, subunit alpha [Spirosomataceae bacterium]
MPNFPSIFNDVIGPVMRGPSSSHCAASLRIGRICRDLMEGQINHILIEFDPKGSLATTHKSQGSDMGLFGGFLGWEAFDERLQSSEQYIEQAGIQVDILIVPVTASSHPNTYQISLSSNTESHRMVAISTGGGMIEVISIDGATVSMAGDYYETLIYCASPEKVKAYLQSVFDFDSVEWHLGEKPFLEIKAQRFLPENLCLELLTFSEVRGIKKLAPVLPIMARENISVPFITCEEMLQYNEGKRLSLWELAVDYESERGNISKEEVFEKMRAILHIMENAIASGLKGTHYEDRILGSQSLQFQERLQQNRLTGGNANNLIIMYVSAIMEVKSSMGVIVAAPTAGSCGALPGLLSVWPNPCISAKTIKSKGYWRLD